MVPKKRIYDELLLSDGRIATANRKRRLTARQAAKGYCYTNGYVLTLYQMFIDNSDFI